MDVHDIGRLYEVADRADGRARAERIAILIHTLGGDGRQYQREKPKAARWVVSEVYSAPRVTAIARQLQKYGLGPSVALDLTVNDETGRPYDFNDPRQRSRADKLFEEQQPFLLIRSPRCTPFSAIQAIDKKRRDLTVIERELVAGRVHLDFCCYLYRRQMARGA